MGYSTPDVERDICSFAWLMKLIYKNNSAISDEHGKNINYIC